MWPKGLVAKQAKTQDWSVLRASKSSLFILLTPRRNNVAAASTGFSPCHRREWVPLLQWNSTGKSVISWRALPSQTCLGQRDRVQGEEWRPDFALGPTISLRAARRGTAHPTLVLLQLKLTNEAICSEKRTCEKMTYWASTLEVSTLKISKEVTQDSWFPKPALLELTRKQVCKEFQHFKSFQPNLFSGCHTWRLANLISLKIRWGRNLVQHIDWFWVSEKGQHRDRSPLLSWFSQWHSGGNRPVRGKKIHYHHSQQLVAVARLLCAKEIHKGILSDPHKTAGWWVITLCRLTLRGLCNNNNKGEGVIAV